MDPAENTFSYCSENITEEDLEKVTKDKPKKLMPVEKILQGALPRNLPYHFSCHHVPPGYSFEPRRKWPNKTVKKYLLNYPTVKAWIVDFKYTQDKGYQFLLGYEVEKKIYATQCFWGPHKNTELRDHYSWHKKALKEGKQITVFVNPENFQDITILGDHGIYAIENDDGTFIAEIDWSKTS